MSTTETVQSQPGTALVPYKAPLVSLITPGAQVTRAALQRLIEEGHDITTIARFHRRAAA